MSDVSVVTIARGRAEHIANVVRGLARQTMVPRELIIGAMQPDLYTDLPPAPFPIRQLRIAGDDLPLAAARNAVARAATGEVLVFLDADCIPAPSLCGDYAAATAGFDGLLMGEVMYLPGGATASGWSFEAFEAIAVRHSDRRAPPREGIERCGDYRCFWSLNFAMRRATFIATGGFDERFSGYGGEDTDFGKSLDRAGIEIAWMRGARAYHQYHPHHMPPIHHIDSVVRNAQLFDAKWGYRTMEHWLRAFRMMGLIAEAPDGIRIVRRPNADDMSLTGQQSHQPYANTAAVIRLLEARAAERQADALSTLA